MTEKRMFIGCRMKIFFSVLLVFCLAGCGSDSAKEAAVPAVPAVPASQVETSEATTSTSQSVDLPALEEYESVLSQRITFTDESADKIREYISNIDVEYEYSSLYHLDEADRKSVV